MKGRVFARKYELQREIGRGGMGSVWEAFDHDLQRVVALKLIAPEHAVSKDYQHRFKAEARALARLHTEYVVSVYDYGIDVGCPYIVMELLEGQTLEARFEREKKMSLEATLALTRQIAAGLTAAAAHDIVHRDLKPANIFLTRGEGGERAKLLDFGVAGSQQVSGSESRHKLVGTPSYMSPEQIRGVAPHRLSDHWSLGVILYRALTGVLPFAGESLSELVVSICTDAHPSPSSLMPGLPAGVDGFFERALAKNVSQRFQTAREFIAAFSVVCREATTTKILVVDDEPDMPLLMKTKFRRELSRSVYEFVYAENGQAALEALERHPDIDVLLTDINMPVMDGLTLLQRIGNVAPFVKAVVVSAYGNMGNIRQAMNAGAFDFVTKPIDFKDLKTTIDKTITEVKERRALARSGQENQLLRKYTSAAVTTRLEGAETLALIDEKHESTVVWFEVAGSERGPGIARTLNANYELIIPLLEAKGGIVDKLLGRELCVVFMGPNQLTRAVASCVQVISQLAQLASVTGAGSPYTPGPRVGVAVGEVLWANLGSSVSDQLRYTAVGACIDEARLIAEAADPGAILVSDAVRDQVDWTLSFAPLEDALTTADLSMSICASRLLVEHHSIGEALEELSIQTLVSGEYSTANLDAAAILRRIPTSSTAEHISISETLYQVEVTDTK